MVHMTEELAGLLGVIEPEKEKRQCVTKVLAAGMHLVQHGVTPTMEEVQKATQEFRLEQARLAVEAEGVMGHPEPKVAPVEHELRMYAHDILKPHHDKDYRALAVFPLAALEEMRIIVVRVDYKGDLLIETVTGSQWTKLDMWVMISKGHMTLLQPPSPEDGKKLLEKEEVYNTPCLGFRYFWHQRHDQAKTAPGVVSCRHCRTRKGGGGDDPEPTGCLRKTTCLPALSQVFAGGGQMVRPVHDAGGRKGLVLQEYFAGHGVITKGWRAANQTALEPIELYAQPHQQLGPRPDHDLSDPHRQEYFISRLKAQDSNVQWIASPCTSFCDWCLQNGGTRTFQNPAGQPTAKEQIGNALSEYGARVFETSLLQGGFPIAESSGTSGRYPKQWHLPQWRRLLQRPDVDFIEIDMCAFGLGPPDMPGHFYRHRTGLAFPHHPPLRQALLRLCPGVSGTHQHIPLKGNRPGVQVSRCTEAGVYAEAFVRTVVETLVHTLVGGGSKPQPPLSKTGGRHPYGWNDREIAHEEEPVVDEGGQAGLEDFEYLNEDELQQVAGMAVDEALGVWNGVEVNNPQRDEPEGEVVEDEEDFEGEDTTEPCPETEGEPSTRIVWQDWGSETAWKWTRKGAMRGSIRTRQGMIWWSQRSCPTRTGRIDSTVKDTPDVKPETSGVVFKWPRSMMTGGSKGEAGHRSCPGRELPFLSSRMGRSLGLSCLWMAPGAPMPVEEVKIQGAVMMTGGTSGTQGAPMIGKASMTVANGKVGTRGRGEARGQGRRQQLDRL